MLVRGGIFRDAGRAGEQWDAMEHPITQGLNDGAESARNSALDRLYEELVHIARGELRRHRRGGTLDTRALVHEAYLKLFASTPSFENRKHFFATAAKAMRQVVIDYARSRIADKRGGGVAPLALDALDGAQFAVESQAGELVAIDAALAKLATLDARLVEVVELRFFAGLEVADIAELLGVSEPTIKRDTRAAKAFLQRELSSA